MKYFLSILRVYVKMLTMNKKYIVASTDLNKLWEK
jgi:hypothetical protein